MKGIQICHMRLRNITAEKTEAVGLDLIEAIGLDFGKRVLGEEFDGYELMFTFLTAEETARVIGVFERHGIMISYRDITEDVLMARAKGTDYDRVFSVEECKSMLNRFLMANLTVDMVLDKISEQGVEGLSVVDKQILEGQ